jgi:hypothetical protein
VVGDEEMWTSDVQYQVSVGLEQQGLGLSPYLTAHSRACVAVFVVVVLIQIWNAVHYKISRSKGQCA